MIRVQNVQAIVLKKRPFMENDLALTVLSSEGLRLEWIVKGAQSEKSRRRAHVERMNLIEATVYKSNRHSYLQSVQAVSSFHHLKSNLDRIFLAEKILAKISESVWENDANPELYEVLLHSFQSLNEKEPHSFLEEIVLLKTAHLLGNVPSFKHCALCHNSILDETAFWDSEQNHMVCSNCKDTGEPLALNHRKALEYFKIASLSDSQKVSLKPEEIQSLKQLIQSLLSPEAQAC